jgi:hypothetical protein
MTKLESRKKEGTDHKNNGRFHFIREYSLLILIFLVSLFVIISFTNPGFFLNDEWITANQLFQLNSGHQLIINEGTYGTYDTGETTEYFITRGNVLQYPLILPIISLPVLRLFGIFGDNFRFLVLLVWSFIPLSIGLLIGVYHPRYGKVKGISWVWPAIIFSFILFLMNMLWYYPFPFTDTHAPREVAAIVFTNHILFALTAVILFQCAMLMYSSDKWKALFAAMLVLVNSSFLFWASNAKDHMLVAFLFSLVILLFIRYFLHRNFLDACLAFIVIGLLIWARPELGVCVFLLSAAFILIFNYQYPDNGGSKKYSFLRTASAVLFIIPGIIPFLINNYIVTGNLFSPTAYVADTVQITGTIVNASTGNASSVLVSAVMQNPLPQSEVLNRFISYFIFSPNEVMSSLPRVLFWPENGSMGLIVVCPLAIFAIITFVTLIKKKISPVNSLLIVYFSVMIIAVFLAYIRLIPLINSDSGIVPDMRYLSPIYIPLGLIGTFSVFTLFKKIALKELFIKYIAIAIISVPVFVLFVIAFQPFGGLYKGDSLCYEIVIYLVIGFLFIFWLAYHKGLIGFQYLVMGILVMLAIPLSWQMMLIIITSLIKLNAYPFWLPIVEFFFNTFFSVKS